MGKAGGAMTARTHTFPLEVRKWRPRELTRAVSSKLESAGVVDSTQPSPARPGLWVLRKSGGEQRGKG